MPDPQSKNAHIFEREENDHYVEQDWTVDLLLDAITFTGSVWDPACGFGTIPKACQRAGIKHVIGTDLIDRGYGTGGQDFLKFSRKLIRREDNIITNPPYKHTEDFIHQGLKFSRDKAAFLVPLKFLASNSRYPLFTQLPIWRVCILSSQPSMLPGRLLASGQKPGGGSVDYCWIVFKHGYTGTPGTIWLARKKGGANV